MDLASLSRPQIVEHPVFLEMKAIPGVSEESAFRSTLIYLDLIERKNWWYLDFKFNEFLQMILIIGSPSKKGPLQLILPTSSEVKLSAHEMRKFLIEGNNAKENIFKKSCTESLKFSPKVTLAIMSSDSTLVYYHISDGLVKPRQPLTAAERLKKEAERRSGKRKGTANESENNVKKNRAEDEEQGEDLREEEEGEMELRNNTQTNQEESKEKTEVDDDDGCGGGGDGWEEDTEGFWDN